MTLWLHCKRNPLGLDLQRWEETLYVGTPSKRKSLPSVKATTAHDVFCLLDEGWASPCQTEGRCTGKRKSCYIIHIWCCFVKLYYVTSLFHPTCIHARTHTKRTWIIAGSCNLLSSLHLWTPYSSLKPHPTLMPFFIVAHWVWLGLLAWAWGAVTVNRLKERWSLMNTSNCTQGNVALLSLMQWPLSTEFMYETVPSYLEAIFYPILTHPLALVPFLFPLLQCSLRFGQYAINVCVEVMDEHSTVSCSQHFELLWVSVFIAASCRKETSVTI